MKIVIDISEDSYKATCNGHMTPPDVENVIQGIKNGTPLPNCKECKFFERDSMKIIDRVPIVVSHEICTKWGYGCKTKEDGYCFLFEPKEDKEEQYGI